jgi:glutamate--cysteine ligase
VLTVRDAKELDADGAARAAAANGGRPRPAEVIIQEGVPTYERINDAVAEPVVYMIDRYVVGGFYRVHAERGIDENLNAPGLAATCRWPLPRATSCRAAARSPAPARRTASTCTA